MYICSDDNTVSVLDKQDRKVLQIISVESPPISICATDGLFYVGCQDGSVLAYDRKVCDEVRVISNSLESKEYNYYW